MKDKRDMGRQDFPHRKGKGLIERAAEMFDFNGALRGTSLPPLAIPADQIPPEPVIRPVAGSAPEASASATVRAADWNGPLQRLDPEKLAENGYIVPGGPVSGLAEEFRIIKRGLLAGIRSDRGQRPESSGNTVLVTSAHPGDGKTWCATNLALSLAAEGDLEVLLVDADFAKPGVPQALGLTGERGLMDALADPSLRIEDMVIRTDIPTLSVLPAGSSSTKDAEYLASARTGASIASLVAGRPDRILLFDSPPLLAASAASVLAGHVDRTLLVVRADRTTETALRDAAELLKGCANVQLLLNGVKFSASGRRFGTYYGREERD